MSTPTLLWLRRDFRLNDNPALHAACAANGPVIPVFIHDDLVQQLGAAPKWRLGLAIAHFADQLADRNSCLILRKGEALSTLRSLVDETGAGRVFWHRTYDPDSITRDSRVKDALKAQGIDARSFGGHVMFEPTAIETKQGGYYKVYSPFWRAVKDLDVEAPLSAPGHIPPPDHWPASDRLEDWRMGDAMHRGAKIVQPFLRMGESAAQDRLAAFMDRGVAEYDSARNLPSVDGTSSLSENLALGEISPHQCWHAGLRARHEGKPGAETFLKELVWREFAYHLMVNAPRITTRNWREEWDGFPWNEDDQRPDVIAWKRARTGMRFVDAGLREMYVTGRMHNRVRMIVASYLTKHLMSHWRIGQKWFEDCLIDWDPAANAMGWQWSAGSGPDATPYFRVFNPVTQRDKFDKDNAYTSRWIAEGFRNPHSDALSYFDAVPRAWGLSANQDYPAPIVSADEGRKRALEAYENRAF